MSWYKDGKDTWKELIETVATETARSNTMVEKDAIQSMFLSNLAKSGLPFVFKGGTSFFHHEKSFLKTYNVLKFISEKSSAFKTHFVQVDIIQQL